MLRGAGAPQCGGCGGPGSRRGVEAGRDGGGVDHGGRGVVEGSQTHSHLEKLKVISCNFFCNQTHKFWIL